MIFDAVPGALAYVKYRVVSGINQEIDVKLRIAGVGDFDLNSSHYVPILHEVEGSEADFC